MSGNFGFGLMGPGDLSSEFNVTRFMIQQMLLRVRTGIKCQVISCTNSGGVAPFGFVTVQPIVSMLDGKGNPIPHQPVYGLCYFRLQGGSSAIIIDPVPGDIGTALVCDRDVSLAKTNATSLYTGTPGPNNVVNPGTWRRFNMADGVFFGGDLNATPTQALQFVQSGGINLFDSLGNTIKMNAAGVVINGVTFERSGNNVFQTHSHSQNPDSHGDTEVNTNGPVPGT